MKFKLGRLVKVIYEESTYYKKTGKIVERAPLCDCGDYDCDDDNYTTYKILMKKGITWWLDEEDIEYFSRPIKTCQPMCYPMCKRCLKNIRRVGL